MDTLTLDKINKRLCNISNVIQSRLHNFCFRSINGERGKFNGGVGCLCKFDSDEYRVCYTIREIKDAFDEYCNTTPDIQGDNISCLINKAKAIRIFYAFTLDGITRYSDPDNLMGLLLKFNDLEKDIQIYINSKKIEELNKRIMMLEHCSSLPKNNSQ